AFLDNVVTQVIASEGDGRWGEYVGGYSDWARARKLARQAPEPGRPAETPRQPTKAEKAAASQPGAKLSFNEKRELETLPGQIAALESEQARLQARLSDPALYRDAPEEVGEATSRLDAVEVELEEAMSRWIELESRTG
ncbi:MAG: ABC transporter ATP-binding protein, partial [Azoarcus sp.]|nr:ABC transporter ATP-binding protein [Azoarcus sp.]